MHLAAIVVWRRPDGRYGLVDGLNRVLVSAEANLDYAIAYVLYPDAPLSVEEVRAMWRNLTRFVAKRRETNTKFELHDGHYRWLSKVVKDGQHRTSLNERTTTYRCSIS